MKEQALSLVAGISDPGQKLNRLREYLQAFVLRSLHESEAFKPLAFVGETALRFLHNLPRFSEDLDFSLVSPETYKGPEWMAKVKRDLVLAGFDAQLAWNDRKVIHTGWIRVAGILHEAGLSGMPEEKLSIKLEIDTRPPAGAHCERQVISRFTTFFIQYYDLQSLLAGKLHAVITRKYSKGRDWYDLLWYLSQRPPVQPNIDMLQKALDQTKGAGVLEARSWNVLVQNRLQSLDIATVLDDVRPFLERSQDAALLTRENLLRLVVT